MGVLTHKASSHLEYQGDWLYGHEAVWLGPYRLYNGLRPTVPPHDFAARAAMSMKKAVSSSQLFSSVENELAIAERVKSSSSTRLVADCKLTKDSCFKN